MKRKVKFLFIIFVCYFFLVGCLPSNDTQEPTFPEVQFTITPNEAKVGEPIKFDAFISVEAKPMEEVDRVEFEIWHEEQEDEEHEHILLEPSGGGHYILEKHFEKSGTYYIYYHVDTMGLHLMEKFEFYIYE